MLERCGQNYLRLAKEKKRLINSFNFDTVTFCLLKRLLNCSIKQLTDVLEYGYNL